MIDCKTFEVKFVPFDKWAEKKEELRQRVKQFINQEVGSEQVVNVTETERGNIFYITVWYRTAP